MCSFLHLRCFVRFSSSPSTADHYCLTLLFYHGRSLTRENDVRRLGAVSSGESAATNWVNTTRREATSLHHNHSLLIHIPSRISLILRRRRTRRLRLRRRRIPRRRRRIYYCFHIHCVACRR